MKLTMEPCLVMRKLAVKFMLEFPVLVLEKSLDTDASDVDSRGRDVYCYEVRKQFCADRDC